MFCSQSRHVAIARAGHGALLALGFQALIDDLNKRSCVSVNGEGPADLSVLSLPANAGCHHSLGTVGDISLILYLTGVSVCMQQPVIYLPGMQSKHPALPAVSLGTVFDL